MKSPSTESSKSHKRLFTEMCFVRMQRRTGMYINKKSYLTKLGNKTIFTLIVLSQG